MQEPTRPLVAGLQLDHLPCTRSPIPGKTSKTPVRVVHQTERQIVRSAVNARFIAISGSGSELLRTADLVHQERLYASKTSPRSKRDGRSPSCFRKMTKSERAVGIRQDKPLRRFIPERDRSFQRSHTGIFRSTREAILQDTDAGAG